MKIETNKPEEVVREAFWLAYQACGRTEGLGFLQARSEATREDVWRNVQSNGDYVYNPARKPGEAYGDYVFGRRMKLGLKWTADAVEVRDHEPRPDYQAWCRKYPTYEALVREAVKNVGG